jgi:ATPase subunit of ABC transporter with duplicated ATPase domains
LRILTGKETPDSGKSWVHKDVTVALFEQDPQFEEGKSVLENIFELNHPIINAIKKYEVAIEEEDADGITEGHADAVLAASIFHYQHHSVQEAKQFMAALGIPMRLT